MTLLEKLFIKSDTDFVLIYKNFSFDSLLCYNYIVTIVNKHEILEEIFVTSEYNLKPEVSLLETRRGEYLDTRLK